MWGARKEAKQGMAPASTLAVLSKGHGCSSRLKIRHHRSKMCESWLRVPATCAGRRCHSLGVSGGDRARPRHSSRIRELHEHSRTGSR